MALEQKTMTAPRAIIYANGVAIGYMKGIRITETINRASVQGLGRLSKREMPALGITCTWNCDFYMINLKETGVPGLNKRQVQSVTQYEDTMMLFEQSLDIYIYKKEMGSNDGSVVTQVNEGDFAIVKDVYISSESFDISENQISGQNQSGEYMSPIIFPI